MGCLLWVQRATYYKLIDIELYEIFAIINRAIKGLHCMCTMWCLALTRLHLLRNNQSIPLDPYPNFRNRCHILTGRPWPSLFLHISLHLILPNCPHLVWCLDATLCIGLCLPQSYFRIHQFEYHVFEQENIHCNWIQDHAKIVSTRRLKYPPTPKKALGAHTCRWYDIDARHGYH